MNDSTLPPLLTSYLPSYEPMERQNPLPGFEERTGDQTGHVNSRSNDNEKKLKNSRATQAQKRMMEAEEKAYKEREEKALHTLKVWNIVKENERRRKQQLLRDRVNLQHQIIRKQDELHQALESQQRDNKGVRQNSHSKFGKKTPLKGRNKAHVELPRHQTRPRKTKTNPKNATEEPRDEKQPINEACEEEKQSEVSYKETFSEEDLSEFVEKPTMEDADFRELRYQPLKVQLEKLFGDKAESFLNPALKESPRKAFDPSLARSHPGATSLWETLRDYSRQKLRNKDALILPDVKNAYACFVRECLRRHITPVQRNFVSEEEAPVDVNIEESDVLRDVRYRRHRQELMFRIAHINKEKTKLLFQTVGAPHYVDTKTHEGLRRYCPQLTEEKADRRFPAITQKDVNGRPHVVTSNTTENDRVQDESRFKKHSRMFGAKLRFLTNEAASCKGQFAKRLVRDGNDKNCTDTNLKQSKSVDAIPGSSDNKPQVSQILWEPLSMEALLDHRASYFEQRSHMVALGTSNIWNMST